jgi:hypothetical protein
MLKPNMVIKSLEYTVIAIVVIGLSVCTPRIAEATPELTGDIKAAECIDAFRFAQSAYNSRASRLYSVTEIPAEVNSKMVLGTLAFDISGGDALEIDEEFFETLPHGDRNVYWGNSAVAGVRIVVQEDSFGWRGDSYSLFLISAHEQKGKYINEPSGDYNISNVPALFGETWRPPLVFRHKPTARLWFISVGQPFEVLNDWNVYRQTSRGFEQGCRISFRSAGEGDVSSLPQTVQRLVGLLDDALGPGNDEGTLQPTAAIRNRVRHVWANAALRPWALTDKDRYNSLEEVNSGLKDWSKKGSSYKDTYRKIMKTYPLAERDLAGYYKKHFQFQGGEAEKLAKWALEIAYCANFTFSNGQNYFRYDSVDNNPWKSISKKCRVYLKYRDLKIPEE